MSITIFTDGSSRGNPGKGGYGAVIRTPDRVIELGGRQDHTTNNRMEITAALKAFETLGSLSITGTEIIVQSDSKYVISGITSWIAQWKKSGWITAGKKEVSNRDLWEALSSTVDSVVRMKNTVTWKYVKGHAGHPGNERCDEIATLYADEHPPQLYDGEASLYTIDLDHIPRIVAKDSKKKSQAPAYSYVSLVNGVFETHKTWDLCEKRVKGVSGAKFKKALSKEDENSIRVEWGVK